MYRSVGFNPPLREEDDMLCIGTAVSGPDDSQRLVAEIGEECLMSGGFLAPVKLDNGTYGVAAVYDDRKTGPRIWTPDRLEAAEAIEHSIEMPRVRHGIGSDVIHVFGRDKIGGFLVKLFYNHKKLELGRVDELHRQ